MIVRVTLEITLDADEEEDLPAMTDIARAANETFLDGYVLQAFGEDIGAVIEAAHVGVVTEVD